MKLEEIRQGFIENLSRISEFWGYPRAMGALYGALYLSQNPLSLDDLIPIVGVTKGAISTNIRVLEQLGMVHKQVRAGDRKRQRPAAPEMRMHQPRLERLEIGRRW